LAGMPLSHGSRMANTMVRCTPADNMLLSFVFVQIFLWMRGRCTSVTLKEQWAGLGKAAETVSSLDHWQQHVCIQMPNKESICHIVVTPCRQLLFISIPAVAQGSHVQPQRSKSELPILWPQLCLAAQRHWLWWPGDKFSHDRAAHLLHMCMDRHRLQVHVLVRIMSVRHL
jgi:hypothetical protein